MSVFGKISGAFKFVAKQPSRAFGAIEDRTDKRTAELSDIILSNLMDRFAALLDRLGNEDTFSGLTEDIVDGVAGKYDLVIPEIVIPEIRIRVERRAP